MDSSRHPVVVLRMSKVFKDNGSVGRSRSTDDGDVDMRCRWTLAP